MIYAGQDALVKVSGSPVLGTGLATTTSDNQTYQISDAAKQVLDFDSSITVYDGGIQTIESYTVNRLNGTITFGSVDATRVITVNAYYLPMSTVASAHIATFGEGCNLMELPKFNQTYMGRLKGQRYSYGTLNQWDIADTYFTSALTTGDPVVIETRPHSSESPKRMFALLESVEMTAALNSPQDMAVSFISTGEYLGG